MRGYFGSGWICVLALLGGVSAVAQTPLIGEEDARPQLIVLVYDYADVSPSMLTEAKGEAKRIFQIEGIEIVWLDSPQNQTDSPQTVARPANLYLTILPRSMARRHPAHKNPDVFGVGTATSAQGIVSVFFDRVEEAAGRKDPLSLRPHPSVGGVLGHVMAHEIGHALGFPHSSAGLMRAHWNAKELTQIAARDLVFTTSQGQSMRTQVRQRAILQTDAPRPAAALQP